jgi:hypothetical protein
MPASRRSELFAAPRSLRHSILRSVGLVASLLASLPLAAQSPATGALHGIVLDSQRQPARGATVRVESDDRGYVVSVISADGTFLLAPLEPGTYTVSVTASDFAFVRSEQVTIMPGQTVELKAQLSAAPGQGSIQIAASLDTAPAPLPDDDGDGLTSSNGLTPAANANLIDGATANQSFGAVPSGTGSDPAPDPDGDPDSAELTTGPANGMARGRHAGVAYVFSQSAVREFHVSGQGYSAQTGHAGDVATTVSRSGTGALHGSAFFVLRSHVLSASDPLAIATSYANGVVTTVAVKPHDLRENFGATLGGPVPRLQSAFYFYTIDQQLRGFPAISSPADATFYALTATQTALLANRGVSPSAETAALNYLSSLTGSTPRRADQTLNFIRLDWRPRKRLALAAEYNAVRWTSPAGLIDAPTVARGRASIGSASGSLDQVLMRATSSFSAHTTNEARTAYTRDLQYETPQTPLAQEPAISPGGLAPEVNIAPNGLLFGTPASLSQIAYPEEQRFQLADTLTLVRGHHLVELGAEVSFIADRVATLANAAGTFSYDSGVTKGYAGGLVDFVTDYTFNVNAYPNGGCPAVTAPTHLFCFRSFSQSFGQTSIAFSTQEWAGFVEDTWRPRSRLTIHAGARYEYTLLPIPFTPNPALDALFGTRGATSVFPEDRNNLGPRAAISYEPFGAGRGIVRLGFGVFFGRLPGATIRGALSDTAQAASTTRIRIKPSASIACPQAPAQGFGYPCAFSAQPSGVVAATTSAMVFDRRFRLPVVEQGSLSLERKIARGTTLTATYTLNLDHQLPGSTDLNIAPSTTLGTFQLQGGTGAPGVQDGETFRLPVYTGRVSPSFGPVTDIVSNVNATYQGLTLLAQSLPRPDLQLRAEYTWSKAIDFGQNQSATPRTNGQFDPFLHGYDKGLSSLNYPWSLRIAGTWTPHLHTPSEWADKAANGWALTPIVVARAGRPYTFDLSGGTLLPGGHESINGSGGALYLPTVGRNTLRLPPTATVDLRLARGFRFTQRTRLLTSAEVFNLLNHRNVSSVDQRAYLVGTAVNGVTPLVFQNAAAIAAEGLNTPPFGTPTAAATSLARARQIQFSVRFAF